MTPEQRARARQLIAELSELLDEADRPKPRKPKAPMPTQPASREAVALVQRRLKRMGIAT